jgi:ADP-heptose:LPS heptosyltransferase
MTHAAATNLIATVLRSCDRKTASAPDVASARRFLFLQYETALGTAVMATPVFAALRKAVPDAFIAVACSGLPGEVLKHNPNIDEIHHTPHPRREWPAAARVFLTTLRRKRRRFDCVALDSGNRQFRYSLLAFMTGVRSRVGFDFAGNLNHESISYDADRSILANNLSLLTLFGRRFGETEPAVFFSPTEARAMQQFFHENRIAESGLIVAIQTQTSGGEPNQWYDDRFVEVAEELYAARRAQMIFLGAPHEQERVEKLRSRLRCPSFSAVGRTDIPGLAALLSRCDLLLTLDTGTMHVGRAVGVPMVVIAPAKNPVHEWLPVGQKRFRVLIRKDIGCARCGKNFCATRECMDEISAGEVTAAIHEQLAEFPASGMERARRTAQSLRERASHE